MATDHIRPFRALAISPCNCGDKVCNRWQLSVGVFYQGTGFDPETAQLLAQAPRLLNELKRMRNRFAGDAASASDDQLLNDVDEVIDHAEHPRLRPRKEPPAPKPAHHCRTCGEECADGVDCCGSDDFPEPADIRETGR